MDSFGEFHFDFVDEYRLPHFGLRDRVIIRSPSTTDNAKWKMEKMAELAYEFMIDPEIRKLATKIVRNVKPKDYEGEVKAIYWWVKNNIRYTKDPYGREGLQTPRFTLKTRAGDCDDMATLICALAGALGHRCKLRAVSTYPPNNNVIIWNHIYAMVQPAKSQKWIAMDTTVEWAYPGWEPPNIYFYMDKEIEPLVRRISENSR